MHKHIRGVYVKRSTETKSRIKVGSVEPSQSRPMSKPTPGFTEAPGNLGKTIHNRELPESRPGMPCKGRNYVVTQAKLGGGKEETECIADLGCRISVTDKQYPERSDASYQIIGRNSASQYKVSTESQSRVVHTSSCNSPSQHGKAICIPDS